MTYTPQLDMFAPARAPVLVAWGAGVDSTAMILKMLANNEAIDCVLFANTGGEKSSTYAFFDYFSDILRKKHGIPVHEVRYEPTNYKNYPPYDTLEGNCLTNKTRRAVAEAGKRGKRPLQGPARLNDRIHP